MDAGPVERWGLDPRFWSFNRFFAGQLLAFPATQLPGVYAARCPIDATTVAPSSASPAAAPGGVRPVLKVEIVGVVVGVDPRRKVVTYLVDDGTGVLPCTVFRSEDDAESEATQFGRVRPSR